MSIAHKETDELIKALEKKIKKEYSVAEKEIEEKLRHHLERYERNNVKKLQDLKDGKITKAEYEYWRTGQVMIGERWEEVRDTIAEDLLNARKIAESYTRDSSIEAFALNHNYGTYEVEKSSRIDTSYTMYNKDAVMRLLKDNPDILPAPKGRVAKDLKDGKIKRWDQQKITSAVTQGVVQGEHPNQVAKRLRQVTNMEYKASIRNARTAMTGAECAGKQKSYERAQDMGIKGSKQWIASMDGKTRHWHVDTDGQTVPVNEPFVNDYGEIDYPGDAGAEPANVYNCRCDMMYVLDGFEDRNKEWLESRHNDALGYMSYEDWKNAHKK